MRRGVVVFAVLVLGAGLPSLAGSAAAQPCRPATSPRCVRLAARTAAARRATRTTVPATTTTVAPRPTMPAGGSDLGPCRLREARERTYQPWNVGFPRGDRYGTPMLPTSGTAQVQLIAIEFPDALGTAAELTAAEAQIAEFDRWFDWTSRGELKFSWQFPRRWYRMPQAVPAYRYAKGDRDAFRRITSDMIAITDPTVDYAGSDFVFVLLPRKIRLGSPDVLWANAGIATAEGTVPNLFGGAEYFYDRGYDLWSAWVHEWGHPMGLAGHAPRSAISIMDDQNGASAVLNVWDTLLAGWIDATELYCMPTTMTSLEMSLIPLERRERGPRGIVVPISATNAVVIESHRPEGWGSRMRAGTYGIAAYWVDTTKDTDRYGSSGGYTDTDQGDKWADHLGPEGRTRQYDLLLPGDSVTYRGVTVTVVRSGAYDTVRVTRG